MFATYEENYEYRASELLSAWSSPAFLRYKYARLGQQSLAIEIVESRAPERQETIVLSVYRSPAAPRGALRRVFPFAVDVQQCDRWYPAGPEALRGTWELSIDELHVVMSGTMSVKPKGTSGSIFVVNCQVVASAPPVLRGGLEQLGASTMKRTLKRGADLTAEWLEIHEAVNAPSPTVAAGARAGAQVSNPSEIRP